MEKYGLQAQRATNEARQQANILVDRWFTETKSDLFVESNDFTSK